MFKFLFYSAALILAMATTYLFLPNIGSIKIHTDYIDIETSVTVFLLCLLSAVLVLVLLLHIMFWFISLPEKILSFYSNYSYQQRIKKFFDLICVLESGNKDELKKIYDQKIFENISHPIVDIVKFKTSHMIKDDISTVKSSSTKKR